MKSLCVKSFVIVMSDDCDRGGGGFGRSGTGGNDNNQEHDVAEYSFVVSIKAFSLMLTAAGLTLTLSCNYAS
ncbi:Hypothetical predicted protein [Octopus vulgaris]|uniref:Uncharacterized protein n=1 Tax=Octopus vulgaris TaxID=6645 RepID=A0AA36FGU7_OCTVU|nr:Hypothetical predicted protein [Octopus vulgaris]